MLPSTGAQPITFATDQNPSNWIVEFQEGYPLGKEIPMEYLFVDLENVAPETFAEVPENTRVYVFSGEKQTRIDTGLAESMLERLGSAKLIRIKGEGKNALDFHIAFYLGKLSESNPGSSFTILSKDKGFDPLVAYMNSKQIECGRIESISEIVFAKNPTRPGLESFLVHLIGRDEKFRPKKVAKLKAYLGNWAKSNAGIVEPIFNELLSQGRIEIDGEKVRYRLNPAKP